MKQQQAVLQAVSDLQPHAYGVTIHQRLERQLGRTIAVGRMFADLEALENAGLLTSEERTVPGPRPRRYFALTEQGAARVQPTRDVDRCRCCDR